MANIIENKERAQFLNLIIKRISKDKLSSKEIKSYEYLKLKVDPESRLEIELTNEWKKAETQYIAERVRDYQNKKTESPLKNPKLFMINLVGKIISFFI